MEPIPKVIHYCWFGGKPLPELALKCIASWKKYCPDYEIVRWDESNYDFSVCDYAREAYEAGKWAFVSDYARFDILYRYGGAYFDTDVELIAPIDDILAAGPFMGRERDAVAPGLGLGANPGLGLFREIMERYQKRHFRIENGEFDQMTVVVFVTEILQERGLSCGAEIQTVAGIRIYPKEYFCPLDYESGIYAATKNTRSIHHYSASWFTDEERAWHEKKYRVYRKFGLFWGPKIWSVAAFARRGKSDLAESGAPSLSHGGKLSPLPFKTTRRRREKDENMFKLKIILPIYPKWLPTFLVFSFQVFLLSGYALLTGLSAVAAYVNLAFSLYFMLSFRKIRAYNLMAFCLSALCALAVSAVNGSSAGAASSFLSLFIYIQCFNLMSLTLRKTPSVTA